MYLAVLFYVKSHPDLGLLESDHLSILISSLGLILNLIAFFTLVFSVVWTFKFSTISIGSDYIHWAKSQNEYKNPKYLSSNKIQKTDNPYV